MLDCKRNRLDYGELLCPPPGYHLDRAVAATYSADLGTLLSIPVALIYAQTLEGDLSGTRFQLLQAIKQFSGQVKIYHQKGQLHVPAKLNWLHAYLEDALVPILPEDPFTSFHPKVWVIRYLAKDEADPLPVRYRVLVLSRNLTSDRSWDLAAALEGQAGKAAKRVDTPLVDFVRWLDSQSPLGGAEAFLEELSRVTFETPAPFESHVFHPSGIAGHREAPFAGIRSKRALVMSPFLHHESLRRIRENTATAPYLFGERTELERMPVSELEQWRGHVLNDRIVEGEHRDDAEEGGAVAALQQLHAKFFLFEDEGTARWFLGSANATEAARTRNVEFLLELKGTASALKVNPRLKEWLGSDRDEGVFLPFDAVRAGKENAEEVGKQREDRLFEHALLAADMRGRVEETEDGKNFDLHLDLDLSKVPPRPRLNLSVQPFQSGQGHKPRRLTPGQRETCTFRNIAEVDLSRFLHFRIEAPAGELRHEFLCRIEIDGIPANRLDNILKRIIDNRDKFFDYLRFLLVDEVTKEDLLADLGAPSDSSNPSWLDGGDWHFPFPIYEQLLVAASRHPRKLAEVDEVIRRLTDEEGERIVPEAFLRFWEAFRAHIPKPAESKE
jgi:hypothetical protein